MTTFQYTSGNPDNLVGGGDADMGDIQGPFLDLRDYLNSGALDVVVKSTLIIGEMRVLPIYPAAVPVGWLLCDGRKNLPRATYSKLFAAIGTSYGSQDAVTFGVPDTSGQPIPSYIYAGNPPA